MTLAVGKAHDSKERWLLVSDEAPDIETFREYSQRFDIEESFLDDKSGAFGLEDTQLVGAEVSHATVSGAGVGDAVLGSTRGGGGGDGEAAGA